MSEFAHPDKFRFFADFTGADPRRKLGDKSSTTEVARQRAEEEEADWEIRREGEGLIAESKDGQRVRGFWPAPGETK